MKAQLSESEAVQGRDTFTFGATIGLPGGEIVVVFDAAIGPLNHDPGNFVALAEAESYGKFGLGEVTRSTFDQARLAGARVLDAYLGADGVAIGLSANERETNTVISGELIIAIEIGRSMVGGHQ